MNLTWLLLNHWQTHSSRKKPSKSKYKWLLLNRRSKWWIISKICELRLRINLKSLTKSKKRLVSGCKSWRKKSNNTRSVLLKHTSSLKITKRLLMFSRIPCLKNKRMHCLLRKKWRSPTLVCKIFERRWQIWTKRRRSRWIR